MNLLSVESLSKAFGARVLFDHISFGIQHGEKVALVARNGTGKTTLFKILRGIEIPDEGTVTFRRDLRIAFLDQEFTLDESKTVMEAVQGSDNQYAAAIREYEAAAKAAEEQPGDKTAGRLDTALQRMNQLSAWDYEKNMKEVLGRLDIKLLDVPVKTFSGGQKKRVALALTLITRPELLIMDEPTNHLDIEMIEWLGHYLRESQLALLMVTHDRYFLDEVCDRILELENGQLAEYRGDYEYYVTKKAEKEQVLNAEIDKAKNLYRREIEWVRRMPKARGTKSKSRLQAFEEIRQKAFSKRRETAIDMSVKSGRLGSKIVELHKVAKRYGNHPILNGFSYTFMNGEKIGIVGKNGVGKTTFIRMLLGEEAPDSGKIQVGDTVVFGYYSQAGMSFKSGQRIIEVVKEIAEFIPLANGTTLSASQLLNRFGFPPEVQYSDVSKLSGGEKRRLYLLTVLVKNPNFLILDEPTNDLDIVTLQVLEEFLTEFKGCVVMVSHDRYFMDKLVDHVFAFEGDGEVKDYPGNYSEYREWKSIQKEAEKEEPAAQPTPAVTEPPKTTTNKKVSYKTQREVEQLEKQIAELESKKKSIESELSSGISDYQKLKELGDALNSVNDSLDEKTMRWMELQEEMGQ